MANQPRLSADELLKACAQQRRAEMGAPLAMPPAMRTRLQQEVARVFSPPDKPAKLTFPGWRLWWPRLAWASGLAGVGLLVILVLLPDSTRYPEKSAANRAATDSPESLPAEPQLALETAQDMGRSETEPAAAPITSPPLVESRAPSAPAPSAPEPRLSARRFGVDRERPTATAQLPMAATGVSTAPSDKPAGPSPGPQAGPLFQNRIAQTQRRRNYNSPPRPQVLDSFQVEQTDNIIRFRDTDGSVYEGALQPAAIPRTYALAPTAKSKDMTLFSNAPSQPALPSNTRTEIGEYHFEAIGTNLTLNQSVVIQGHLQVQQASPLSKRPDSNRPGPGAAPIDQAMRSTASSIARIQGTITLARTNQWSLDAQLNRP